MRETKTFTTKSGHKVVMYTFITGGEDEQIQNIFLEDVEVTQDRNYSLKVSRTFLANHKAIELMVVSVDDKTDNILKTVLDLPKEDYDEVIKNINEIKGKASQGEKK